MREDQEKPFINGEREARGPEELPPEPRIEKEPLPEIDSETEPGERDETEIREAREAIEGIPDPVDKKPPVKNIPPVSERVLPANLLQMLQRDRLDTYTANARHILGKEATDAKVANLARQTFNRYMDAIRQQVGEMLRPNSAEHLAERTKITGLENLNDAIAKYGRAIVVVPHSTFFPIGMKLAPQFLPEHTRGTMLTENDIAWPITNLIRRIGRSFSGKAQEKNQWDIIAKTSKNPKTMTTVVHRLRNGEPGDQGEVLFLAGDRGDLSPPDRRTSVDFLDSKTNFPTGPTAIARMTNYAPILPAEIYQEDDGSFSVRIGESIFLDREKPEEDADHEAMQRVADFFSDGIKEHPDQWPVYRHDFWPEQKDFRPAK